MSHTTQIVVTGGEGTMATALRDYFPLAEFPSHRELDVANPQSCRQYFGTRKPEIICHLAAETRPFAPAESYLANNVLGTAQVTQWATRLGARLVYTSTDYVYPGLGTNWRETDPVRPVNAYAQSKLGGECAASLCANHLIVRGSWYADLPHRVAAVDMFTSKVPVAKAAAWLATLITSGLTGIVNLGGPRRSVYECCVTENPKVEAVRYGDYRLPAYLPKDSSLNLDRFYSVVTW